jgi:hypothetical protein
VRLGGLRLVLFIVSRIIRDIYLGNFPSYLTLFCWDGADFRLIATMVFEIGAFSIAGLMALYFHYKNKKADTEGRVLEGQPGFRYTT